MDNEPTEQFDDNDNKPATQEPNMVVGYEIKIEVISYSAQTEQSTRIVDHGSMTTLEAEQFGLRMADRVCTLAHQALVGPITDIDEGI